ncbi:hypothetical protein NHQ30_004151 [Ciborinia camelliae]|nr:hypothetical protein NHQ30_004151 [Ciborinia camelliae]
MEPDLEAAAEAPRVSPAMRTSSQRDNIDDCFQHEAGARPEALQSEGIRRRNTDQATDSLTAMARELRRRNEKDAAAAKETPERHRLKGHLHWKEGSIIEGSNHESHYCEWVEDTLMTKLMANQGQYGQDRSL